ncbi:ATP-dependent helicase/nuclease subunit A [Dissostichus eleginoides]|uniref:ATP-dependent helicase/nuclease subunit A n=1 Tax=Dissostichus eleginoides TaxID=100907 RepID=A0AAD9B5W9_DISEL|nr:ATP-dependent helicase/nuclease subunit A [Dissostichus eleginoides]
MFHITVREIQRTSQDYDGHVDLKKFWDAVTVEMLSRGFIPYGKKNPFVVPLSYNNWAPWIGPQTRQSDLILNTEFQKIPTTTMSDDSEYLEVTEERLSDEIINLRVIIM